MLLSQHILSWPGKLLRRFVKRTCSYLVASPTQRTGAWGERIARRHIEAHNLITVRRNWRADSCEADIVALEHRQLIVLEVKTRHHSLKSEYPALRAVGGEKRQRLHRLAMGFLRNHGPFCRRNSIRSYRVDAIEVYYTRTRLGHRRVSEISWHRGLQKSLKNTSFFG